MKYIIITSLLLWGCTTTKPIADTKLEAKEEADLRYEVRIGFSDYTYSNGTWKDAVFTSHSLKESKKYLNEYNSTHTDLVIYDLRSGNVITTSAP
tara:strand:+ start:982 stop:1266 length:285 start_codon:yes stop_codon:yes gene_type:complete